MEVKKQVNQENWDNWLIKKSQNSPFPQSWSWGDILIAEGKKVERLAVLDGNDVLLQAQVVYNKLPLGMKYAFCPKGPIIKSKTTENRHKILEELFSYFKKQGVIFLRIESSQKLSLDKIGYSLQETIDVNPSSTLILNIKKWEEELLKEMHSKTRYNIRLAEKKGVKIKPVAPPCLHKVLEGQNKAIECEQEKNFGELMRLMELTGDRDGFRLHPKEHYKKILDSEMSIQSNAYFEGNIIATAVFLKFGDTFTYLYGASDYEYRKVMAPNLLQWEGIRFAKSLGYKYYDFFGIAPMKNGVYDKKHQYSGVTRFKLGFGGSYREEARTFDIIINKQKYYFYTILRKLRRLF